MSERKTPGMQSGETAAEIEITRLQNQLRRAANSEAETKRLSAKLEQAYNASVPFEYARDRRNVLQMSRPVAITTVQRSLGRDETVIEYVLNNNKTSFAFELTSAKISVHELPRRDAIDKLVHEYLKLIRSKQDSSELASKLFRQIVVPALSTNAKSVTNNLLEPDRTGLVPAPGDGSDDGLWQAREIRRSYLTADLVTLSACETGVGRLKGEEGIMNLSRSFRVAGV